MLMLCFPAVILRASPKDWPQQELQPTLSTAANTLAAAAMRAGPDANSEKKSGVVCGVGSGSWFVECRVWSGLWSGVVCGVGSAEWSGLCVEWGVWSGVAWQCGVEWLVKWSVE